MDMGLSGVNLSKPGSEGNTNLSQNTTDVPGLIDSDIYDPVTEDPNFVITPPMFNNTVKYI